jgi:hypothetical protein
MPWFLVDDDFAFHPKAEAAGDTAIGLWTRAGAYCNKYLTEGFVSTAGLRQLRAKASQIKALVDADLWIKEEGGYRFHPDEWDRQKTKSQVEAERAAAADRQRRARDKARESRRDSRSDETEPSRRDSRQQSRAPRPVPKPEVQNQTPDPLRGSPPQAEPSRRDATPSTKGTRLPDDFAPTHELITWARSNTPDVPAIEHEAFVDFWRAQAGAKGVKADWAATWRTWMRRAQADIRSGRRAPAGPKPSTTDQRVSAALDLARQLHAEEQAAASAAPHLEIGA